VASGIVTTSVFLGVYIAIVLVDKATPSHTALAPPRHTTQAMLHSLNVRLRKRPSDMRILITGGAGFIGSALIRHLIQHTEHEVLNLDKLTYAGNLESLASSVQQPL
jgi:hypothetical protein